MSTRSKTSRVHPQLDNNDETKWGKMLILTFGKSISLLRLKSATRKLMLQYMSRLICVSLLEERNMKNSLHLCMYMYNVALNSGQ